MSHVKHFESWIDNVIPKIIKNLELDVDKIQYEILDSNIFIMSYLYRVRLQFENKTNGQNEELFMILKRPRLTLNQIDQIDCQFHNEILFYQMYVKSDEDYAKCFYVEEQPPIDSVIALENVNKRGYYCCPYMHNPPLEYTLAAMRELGRFHGKGYAMKEFQRKKFFDIVARIQEVRFAKRLENIYEFYANILPLRAVEYLRAQDYDPIFCDKMETLFSNLFNEVIMKIIQPIEPLATLCHGDFTLSNILFKAEGNGQYRSMLIDFALIRYSTPVVDLSTYVYLYCSNKMRKAKFFEIMWVYHDALKEYLLEVGIQDVEKYSYNALLDDFRRGALFGFTIMCFFLPILLGYLNSETFIKNILELGPLESVKKLKSVGGDEVSKILADALLHLRSLGCFK